MVGLRDGSSLAFPRLRSSTGVHFALRISNGGDVAGHVEVVWNDTIVAKCEVSLTGSWSSYVELQADVRDAASEDGSLEGDLMLRFVGGGGAEFAHLDFIRFGSTADTDEVGLDQGGSCVSDLDCSLRALRIGYRCLRL